MEREDATMLNGDYYIVKLMHWFMGALGGFFHHPI